MPDEQGPMPLAASIVGRWHYDETMTNMGVVPFRHRATPEIYHPFDHEVSADPTKNQSMRVSTTGGHGKIPLKWGPRDFRMFPCKPSLAGFRWGCPMESPRFGVSQRGPRLVLLSWPGAQQGSISVVSFKASALCQYDTSSGITSLGRRKTSLWK